MSIDAIRSELQTTLAGISGVSKCYKDEPNISPDNADLPAFVISYAQPACDARSATNSSIEYTWHFNIRFLYKPVGLGNIDANMSAVEDYVKLFVDAMSANITGGGVWQDWNKDTGNLAFTVGLVETFAGEQSKFYWGYTVNLDITEIVTTTMSAG